MKLWLIKLKKPILILILILLLLTPFSAVVSYSHDIFFPSKDAETYFNRGFAKKNLGDNQGAIADYKEAAKLYQQQNKTNDYQDALNRVKELERQEFWERFFS